MEATAFKGAGYILQPRINLRRSVPQDTSAQLVARQEEDCQASGSGNSCERPISADSTRLPIILGIVIPVVLAIGVLFYLHRRTVRRHRAEDAKDPNSHLDFGLGDAPMKKSKRKSILGFGEKQLHKPGQLSMDMNLSSPYLLPPGAHQSHDSLHSLARQFPNQHDPYRTISHYTGSETASIYSAHPRDPSGFNSKRASVVTGKSIGTVNMPPPRTNSMPKPPMSPDAAMPHAPTAPRPARHSMLSDKETMVSEATSTPYPNETPGQDELHMPDVRAPPATLARDPLSRNASPALPTIHAPIESSTDLGFDLDFPKPASNGTPSIAPQPALGSQPQIRTSVYSDEFQAPEIHDARGRPMDRDHPEEAHGLAVPAQNSKRLSVGFRPLPPDEVTESEDPEYRANRIRSFYKEYFEDSRDAGPVPEMPELPRGRQGPQYYEDYDAGYMGDAAYYDADSNAFVMPYAQPVTRRAMTPPPAGRRGMPGPGPRGPYGPHGPHGSVGGMSMPGGPRRPRAGSAGFRAPSSLGPRPGSSASGRGGRYPPKKKGPPPADLSTLPAPSKLKDDSFAIMNAMDFAPPSNFKDQAAGRSQSPLGERRPYQGTAVPVSSPLVTAFDELGALPSPHSLRKSYTFTNLDFAPPKKFKDSDTMSDAGSIRSNRSGISAANLSAIRGGAGRVSRLPEDMVFTAASMDDQLKPNWGMRP